MPKGPRPGPTAWPRSELRVAESILTPGLAPTAPSSGGPAVHQCISEPIELFLGVVVVNGGPDKLAQASVGEVELRVLGHGHADVDPAVRQQPLDLGGGAAGDREGDDSTPPSALVVEID